MGKKMRQRSVRAPEGTHAADTHYVIVIHGTWNAYDGNSVPPENKWYWSADQSAPVFINRLRESLRGTPFEGAIWRTVPGLEWPYSWTGSNSHEARLMAARELAEKIIQIVTVDPSARIHFIAHSHGGNVLLKSLEIYLAYLADGAANVARCLSPDIKAGCKPSDLLAKAMQLLPQKERDLLASRRETLDHWIKNLDTHFELPETLDQFGINRSSNKHAATKLFIDEWQTSRLSNRIGKLIFVGVPFLHKNILRPSFLTQWLAFIGHLVGLWLIAYCVSFSVGYVISIVTGIGDQLRALPLPAFLLHAVKMSWPPFVLLVWLTIGPSRLWLDRFNSRLQYNFYFDPWIVELRHPARPPFLEGLILSAPKIDEAFLALDSDRIAFASILPSIRSLVGPSIRSVLRWPPYPDVLRPSLRNNITYLAWLPFRLVGVLIRALAHLTVYPFRMALSTLLASRLARIVNAISTGVAIEELENCRLVVRSTPELPSIIAETMEDVTHSVLAQQDERNKVTPTRSERFNFLLDPEMLEDGLIRSPLWASVKGELASLRKRFADFSDPDGKQVDADAKLACLAIETLAKEALAATDLNHARYYDNPTVVAKIAEFLVAQPINHSRHDPNWRPAWW